MYIIIVFTDMTTHFIRLPYILGKFYSGHIITTEISQTSQAVLSLPNSRVVHVHPNQDAIVTLQHYKADTWCLLHVVGQQVGHILDIKHIKCKIHSRTKCKNKVYTRTTFTAYYTFNRHFYEMDGCKHAYNICYHTHSSLFSSYQDSWKTIEINIMHEHTHTHDVSASKATFLTHLLKFTSLTINMTVPNTLLTL